MTVEATDRNGLCHWIRARFSGGRFHSTYPDSAKLLKTVGYHRALSPEPIIAMAPHLVMHSHDIGPDNVLPQLEKAGLTIKAFSCANSIDSARLRLRELGSFFHREQQADSLVSVMDKPISIISLLLTGIAINAVCLSGTGFVSCIARDPQARSITFWNLGTFAGASWLQVGLVGAVAAVVFLLAGRFAKELNALLLGEEEAACPGVDATKMKKG